MKNIARALAFALGLLPLAAMAQSAPANLPANTVYGRLGFPGTVGPGQTIPFANLQAAISTTTNIATPEAYGAPHDGVHDDGPAIDAALLNLSLRASGGTLQLSCGTTYTISSVSPNAKSAVRLFSNVNIVGCGDSSVIRMANGLNTSSAFVWGLYATGTANNVRYAYFTIDMNGANNSCGGTCYFSNAALGIATGNDISVSHIRFINNPGSNDTVFGTNVASPTVSNLHMDHLVHEHYGDIVNPASADFSADFIIAKNYTLDDIIYSDGARVNGAAFELHGDGATASNLVVNDNFACGIIANEPGFNTDNIVLSNVKCNDVTDGPLLFSFSGSALSKISIDNVIVNFKSGVANIAVDACSNVNSASTNTLLSLTNITSNSGVTTNLGNEAFAISACWWSQIDINGVRSKNTQGGAVLIDNVVSGASITLTDIQATSPGHTSTTANQVAVLFKNTSANGAASIAIASATSTGSVQYNISSAVTATQATITSDSLAAGAAIGQWNVPAGWSGVILPQSSTNFRVTGGTGQFVKQATTGGPFTVSVPTLAELNGTLQAAQEPAHTGDVTNTAGSLALALAATQAGAHTWSAAQTHSGQIISTFGTPTIASGACGTGTNGTISGTNQSGTITIGAAATTSCTVSFSATITAPSSCHLTPGNAAAAQAGTAGAFAGTPGTTSWAITGLALANTVYRYLCL